MFSIQVSTDTSFPSTLTPGNWYFNRGELLSFSPSHNTTFPNPLQCRYLRLDFLLVDSQFLVSKNFPRNFVFFLELKAEVKIQRGTSKPMGFD